MLGNRTKNTNSNAGIRVISRAADILRALMEEERGLSLGAIAARVGLPRSTVQRLVNALTVEGFVVASSIEGGLRLGPEIQALAAAGRVSIVDLTGPILEDLSQRTGETVDLSVFREDHMLFVDQVVGSGRLRAVSAVGEIFPMTTTANGKATLAQLDDELVDAIAKREFAAVAGGKQALRHLHVEITQVRKTALAFDLEEHTEGISAVGGAFTTATGSTYAISIPVPSLRFARLKNKLTEELLDALESVRSMV